MTSTRRCRHVVISSVLLTVSGFAGASAMADDVIYDEIVVPDVLLDTSTEDINARSEFRVSEQVARAYVAVTVEITKSSITPVDAALVRGPPEPAQSATKDLAVRVLQGSRLALQYSIRDPRLRKHEPGVTGRPGKWIELPKADKLIYVPLSSAIDKVVIRPAPGRFGAVSAGGDFDPRPWATAACAGFDPVIYAACDAILALGIPPPP